MCWEGAPLSLPHAAQSSQEVGQGGKGTSLWGVNAPCALPSWSSGPPWYRAQGRDTWPSNFPTSSLSAKRGEKAERQQEGGKEKVHSCCSIHLGFWNSASDRGRGLCPFALYTPPLWLLHSGPSSSRTGLVVATGARGRAAGATGD